MSNANAIRCIVIKIEDKWVFCDGTVHEFDTDKEYRAFADGVREGATLYGGKCGVYTKDAYGKLPADGNSYIQQFLINPMKEVKT